MSSTASMLHRALSRRPRRRISFFGGALLLGLLALVAVPRADAESIFGQSYYGNSARISDARAAGRGGMGLAYTDTINANVLTPTQLVDLRHVAVSLTMAWGRSNSQDEYGQVERWDIYNPTLRVGGRIRGRVGYGFGYEARRSTHWTIVRPSAASPDPEFPVTEVLEREGTLFDFPFEMGFQIFPHVRLGGGIILVRGTVRQRYNADVQGAGTSPADVREDIFSGTAAKFAIALHDLGPLSLAGQFVPTHQADVQVNQRGISPESAYREFRTDTLPLRYSVGARLQLPGRWSMGTDYQFEKWSEYMGRVSYEGNLEDEWSIHGGLELEEEGFGRRHKRPFRVGGWYRKWNYSLLEEPITEWGVSAGTSITLKGPFSRADLALQFGKAGSMGANGAEEEFFRVVFSITGGEKWY